MSALRTPTLPRRDTLRAHPQPRAALLRQAEGGVCIHHTESVSKQRSPHILGHGCTHRRVPNRRHSQQQSHISHTCQSNTDKTVNRRLLLPPQTQSRTATVFRSGQTATRAIKHAIITFEHSNQPIIHSFTHSSTNHSFKQTFITNIHSLHSSIRLNHSSHSFNHSSFNQGQRAGGVKSVEVFEEASALLTEREAVRRRFN